MDVLLSRCQGQTERLLGTIHRWNFSIFTLNKFTNGKALSHLCLTVFHEYNLVQAFDLDLCRFVSQISIVSIIRTWRLTAFSQPSMPTIKRPNHENGTPFWLVNVLSFTDSGSVSRWLKKVTTTTILIIMHCMPQMFVKLCIAIWGSLCLQNIVSGWWRTNIKNLVFTVQRCRLSARFIKRRSWGVIYSENKHTLCFCLK